MIPRAFQNPRLDSVCSYPEVRYGISPAWGTPPRYPAGPLCRNGFRPHPVPRSPAPLTAPANSCDPSAQPHPRPGDPVSPG